MPMPHLLTGSLDTVLLLMYTVRRNGYVNQFAPATEGDLVIVNNGDGTYQLTFSFLDDLGHTWDGTWSGTISPVSRRL